MYMLTDLMIFVGIDAADVWSCTNAPAPLDLVGGREEGEMKDIFEIYTTRHIGIIARKNL